MAMEIERKWLIKDIKDIPLFEFYSTEKIRQAYLMNKDKHVIRVRSSHIDMPDNRVIRHFREATLTVKGPSGGDYPDEYEMKIPVEYAEKFMEGIPVLEKTRKKIKIGDDIVIEVDIFTSFELLGLIIAEVEFKSLDMADYFLTPNWFGEEVTFDREYSNANLYRKVTK